MELFCLNSFEIFMNVAHSGSPCRCCISRHSSDSLKWFGLQLKSVRYFDTSPDIAFRYFTLLFRYSMFHFEKLKRHTYGTPTRQVESHCAHRWDGGRFQFSHFWKLFKICLVCLKRNHLNGLNGVKWLRSRSDLRRLWFQRPTRGREESVRLIVLVVHTCRVYKRRLLDGVRLPSICSAIN